MNGLVCQFPQLQNEDISHTLLTRLDEDQIK
jgi:hypothetical protein